MLNRMIENSDDFTSETYLNPVYPHSFPDPFVLKFRGEYFAYCTGMHSDDKVFTVLRSRNLIDWVEIGGAMNKLDHDSPFYWAPEVTYSNGKFYLYYSVGNETLMEIRVAISDVPDSRFVDAGIKLTSEEFAIDAHIFIDDTGEKYLFYATDFLTHSHIGTGIVVDKMLDFFRLEGNPKPVARARHDWQIYDANRIEKGGVRWHTVEGAFVLKRKNTYFVMFSGGNWQNISYGVSFAVTNSIETENEWTQFSDGVNVLPILRTLPERVVGPGHNSVIRGLNNRELFCIYHCWTADGRVLAIDRMDFAGNRIFINGATYTPQLAPYSPNLIDFFDDKNPNLQTKGEWKFVGNEAICEISPKCELSYQSNTPNYLCEFSLRIDETIDHTSSLGFCLRTDAKTVLEFSIFPASNLAILELGEKDKQKLALPNDFNPLAIHLLRVEVDDLRVRISLDEGVINFDKMIDKNPTQIVLTAKNSKAAFSGFAMTEGFEDLFDWKDTEIEEHGWQKSSLQAAWYLQDQELFFENKPKTEAILTKGKAERNFEFTVNIRLVETFDPDFDFGFLLLDDTNEIIQQFSLNNSPLRTRIYDPEIYHQFSFLKLNEKLVFQCEGTNLGEFVVPSGSCKIGIFSNRSTVALDMLRLTVL